MTLNFPKLTSYQQDAYDWFGDPYGTGKVLVLKSVRQSGKTFFIQVELAIMAFKHPKTLSIVYEPTLALARQVYKSMAKAFEEGGLIKNANGQLLEIEFTNGSSILFKSTEQVSRGLTVTGLLVLDECAYLVEDEIFSILPLISAHNAPLIIASTPFSCSGYYYEMYLRGLNGEDPLIKTFDWSKHPEVGRFLTEEKKEMYRQTMSRAKFTTEILGEFLTDGGLLFQGLNEVLINEAGDGPVVYCGIDFGTGSEKDYTVLSVIDNRGNMVELHRTNNLTPTQQVDWLCGLILDLKSRKEIKSILCEWNSIGSVYIDMMKKRLIGLPIQNWVTTNKSKQDLVTMMQVAIENGYIHLLSNPNLIAEMLHYQADINIKTKVVTYNGAKGYNDDTVIATMLAYWAYKKGMGNFSISFA